jgi:hypothetical protein
MQDNVTKNTSNPSVRKALKNEVCTHLHRWNLWHDRCLQLARRPRYPRWHHSHTYRSRAWRREIRKSLAASDEKDWACMVVNAANSLHIGFDIESTQAQALATAQNNCGSDCGVKL